MKRKIESGSVTLRVMGAENDIKQAMEILSKAVTITQISNEYTNRDQSGVRVYMTMRLKKEENKS